VKLPVHLRIGGLKVISFPAEPKKAVEANRLLSHGEAWAPNTPEASAEDTALPPFSTGRLQESLNRLDTQLCFALAREDLALKTRLTQQRTAIAAQCAKRAQNRVDKLLPTAALQSQKHSVELEITKVWLQFHAKPTATQVALKEALDRELLRRIPERFAQQRKERACLQGLSNNAFLRAYQLCAKQLYKQACLPDTPYASLVTFWGKWQTHTQEAETRFGDAWLWQYI